MDWNSISPWATIASTAPSGGPGADVTTGQMGQVGLAAIPSLFHPDHPMFWVAAFGAVTFGLIGASTHLRVGPFKVGASAGKGN